MQKMLTLHALVFTVCILMAAPVLFGAGGAEVNLVFEHQDPAGDVLKYNATLGGVPVEDEPVADPLDIKWVYTEGDGEGNLILTMDLKAKNKFIHEDNTKYVFRIITAQDNSSGYNITYQNNSCKLIPFSTKGNGTSIDIIDNVSFGKESGDEKLTIAISILQYLDNITYFTMDAYSMKVMDNATYLDYISELPGHPEYIDAGVEEGEDLEDVGEDGGDGDEDEGAFGTVLILIIAVIFLLLIVVVFMMSRKRKEGKE